MTEPVRTAEETLKAGIQHHREARDKLLEQIKARELNKFAEYVSNVGVSRDDTCQAIKKEWADLCDAYGKKLAQYMSDDYQTEMRIRATLASFRQDSEEASRRAQEEYEKRVWQEIQLALEQESMARSMAVESMQEAQGELQEASEKKPKRTRATAQRKPPSKRVRSAKSGRRVDARRTR
jgi:hypothetical protein